MKNKVFSLLLMLLVSIGAFAQSTTVSGSVFDEQGLPFPGASVVVAGTTLGTITDMDGKFQLQVEAAAAKTLQISCIGFETQKVSLANQTTGIKAVLVEESIALNEVVAVGYGTQKKRDVVGSVSSVSSDALVAMPVASVTEAMTGKMAGVSITTTEGDPDADVKIRVRGGGSITQDNSPLYIVDGFPVESITDVPASDIQSIDVLKDAFSTAIYGARGANGVIIVTTKGGGKGSCKVSYNAYYGYKKMANKDAIQPMSVSEFVKYQYELAAVRDRVDKEFTPFFGNFQDIDLYDNIKGNDWVEQVFGRVGSTFSQNLSVSGGADKVKWNVSYAHVEDRAIMIGSKFSRDNLNLKANYNPFKKISFDFSVRYSGTDVRGSGANSMNDAGSTSGNGRLKHAVLYSPIPLSSVSTEVDLEEDYGDNVQPLISVADNDSKRERTNWIANGAFTWEIIDNLKLRVEGGIDEYKEINNRFYGMTTYYSIERSTIKNTPSNNYQETTRKKIRSTNTLNYDFKKLLGDNGHNVNVLVGHEFVKQESNKMTNVVDGLPTFFDAEMAWNFMGSGSAASITKYYNPDDVLLSFFGRANYDFNGRYSLSATMRADGSSKFGEGNKWGYFPSAAAAWRLSDESWFEGAGWIDNLKLRYSFGTAGNNNIPTGQISKEFSPSPSTYIAQGTTIWTAGKVMSNPDLKWETTYSHNVGFDFSFLKGFLSGSLEVYQNNTKDLLIQFPVSGSGYDTQYRNLGETRNRGAEVSLTANLIQKEKYGVSITANVSMNRNKVVSLGGLDKIDSHTDWASTEVGVDYRLVEGGKMGDIYGYVSAGRYKVEDFEEYNGEWKLKNGATNAVVTGKYQRPGGMKLADLNEDGVINTDDRKVIGNAAPKATGGFSINAYAYGFDLGANFNWVYGNDIYNANKVEFNSSRKYTTHRNATNDMALGKRWTNIDWTTGELVNDGTRLEEMNKNTSTWSPCINQAVFSDAAVEDGSFLRLSSLTVGYTIPSSLTDRIHVEKLRFYATGTNLFCLTNYSGYDPEVDTRRSTPLTPGVDYSAYPKSIGFVCGLNLNF